MTNIEVANASGLFPVGTTVKAFPKKGLSTSDPLSGPPSGAELGNAVVAANGSLSIAGGTEGTSYLLYANVSGTDRYMSVRIDQLGETTVVATQANGDFEIVTVGKGLRVKEGANAKMGSATLAAGTVTVANTSVTANSRIFVTRKGAGANPGALTVSAKVAATSFTVTSTSGTDVGELDYFIVEPA